MNRSPPSIRLQTISSDIILENPLHKAYHWDRLWAMTIATCRCRSNDQQELHSDPYPMRTSKCLELCGYITKTYLLNLLKKENCTRCGAGSTNRKTGSPICYLQRKGAGIM